MKTEKRDKAFILLSLMVSGKTVSKNRILDTIDYLNRTGFSDEEFNHIIHQLVMSGFVEIVRNRFKATSKARALRVSNLDFLNEVRAIEDKLEIS